MKTGIQEMYEKHRRRPLAILLDEATTKESDMDAVKGMEDEVLRQELRNLGIEAFEGLPVDVMERHELEMTWLVNQSVKTVKARKELTDRLHGFIRFIKNWEERFF